MNKLKPYCLQDENHHSDGYYAAISAFTGMWLATVEDQAGKYIRQFQAHQTEVGLAPRTFAERAFEILAIGVLLREHGEEIVHLPAVAAWLMDRMVTLQERLPQAKRLIKIIRGLAAGSHRLWQAVHGPVHAVIRDMECLVRWLQAQGEDAQAERFTEWLGYLQTLPEYSARRLLMCGWNMARDFTTSSQSALGGYTADVEFYRMTAAGRTRWRYDSELVTRSQVEYHLGMLGNEILNRVYRGDFETSRKRLVIVPPCLRALPEIECKAVQTPLGAQCSGCTPTCRVHQVTKLGEKRGVMVTCVPDDQLGMLCTASGQAGSGLGVIGVACATRNWSAGWEAEHLGLHAQGLLLDYPGCKKHWLSEDVPTDINLRLLDRMLDIGMMDHS